MEGLTKEHTLSDCAEVRTASFVPPWLRQYFPFLGSYKY